MKVLVIGGAGVIGRRLLPLLLEAGHETVGTTRSAGKANEVEALGAEGVVCDVLDRQGVSEVVRKVGPEVVVHQATSIPARIDPRNILRDFEMTNRLRTEGTRNLVQAAKDGGVRRVVAQSIAFAHRPDGSGLKTERDPLFLDAPSESRPLVEAIADLETQIAETEIEGVVLRYGYLYGPGTIYARGGSMHEDVSRRRVPVVGAGTGVFSFVHVDDAARATVAALTAPMGTYQIVDDEPAPVREWLPHYAATIGAPPPRRVPVWLARLAIGSYGVTMMLEQRGASNRLAGEVIGWRPEVASWRTGFAT